MLGRDIVDHAVELFNVHVVHGRLDAAFDIEFLDDERQAFRADEVFQLGTEARDQRGGPLPELLGVEDAADGIGEVRFQIIAQILFELGTDVRDEAADLCLRLRRLR